MGASRSPRPCARIWTAWSGSHRVPRRRRGGRAVEGAGLENRNPARDRGFESLPLRQFSSPAEEPEDMAANPLDGFTVDRSQIRLIGQDLQRPECILAERDGTLWAAAARGGGVRIG